MLMVIPQNRREKVKTSLGVIVKKLCSWCQAEFLFFTESFSATMFSSLPIFRGIALQSIEIVFGTE